LNHIQGSIIIPDKPTIRPLREHDIPIMSASTLKFSKSDLLEINACQMFLQVVSLSEIANQKGDSFLQLAIKGIVDSQSNPTLWKTSKNPLNWPRQTYLSTIAWKKWKKYLRGHLNSQNKIVQPLGSWYKSSFTTRYWCYRYYRQGLVHQEHQDTTILN
jgi:hypothetical protein